MNNLKNNTKRVPRQLARRKPVRSCERISIELYSQVFHLFAIRLDKVLSVTDGDTTRTYTYHADGQLASATVGGDHRAPRTAPQSETFLWDGLALVKRGESSFINEPHIGNVPQKLCFGGEPRAERRARRARKGPRGNPVASSKGTSYFNDALGTTLGTTVGTKTGRKYSAAALTAFGEDLQLSTSNLRPFFTGKPHVEGLGYTFLFRNYRAGLAKWQTADPMGYPDGWNRLAYCNNGVIGAVDLWGGEAYGANGLTDSELSELARALRSYSLGGAWLGGIVDDRPLSRSFLFRYMWEFGDQTLPYSTVSGQAILNSEVEKIILKVRNGDYSSGNFGIAGGQWSSDDLSSSLGGVTVKYWVEDIVDASDNYIHIVHFNIDDIYDFHSSLDAQMPYLDFYWDGPAKVYDTWMRQLAGAGYAKVFTTHIAWEKLVE